MNHSAWWVAGLLALPACNGKDDTADTSEGLNGPSMVHVEFEDSFASGSEITFSVDADDEDGVGGWPSSSARRTLSTGTTVPWRARRASLSGPWFSPEKK